MKRNNKSNNSNSIAKKLKKKKIRRLSKEHTCNDIYIFHLFLTILLKQIFVNIVEYCWIKINFQ